MYCGNCGAQVPEGTRFCSECGSPMRSLQEPPNVPGTSAGGNVRKVVLRSFPPDQKTAVMRLLCKTAGMDLAQARSVIDRPKLVVKDRLTISEAESIAEEFRRVGAAVDILGSAEPVEEADVQKSSAATCAAAAVRLCCPICGSTNCTPIVETSSSGSDFSASKGCCGYIMLGPIGLLCGACGGGKQTRSTTYWMCSNCGNKFQK